MEKLRKWKRGMELKGLRVNISKTKVMRWAIFKDMWRDLIWGKRLTLA